MYLDFKLMLRNIFGPTLSFLKANIIWYCFFYCAITTIGSNYKQIIEVMLKVPSNIWRLSAAMGIVLLNVKLYLHFNWTQEEMFRLSITGPKNVAECVFYIYLQLIEKTVRFLKNVKLSVTPTQHYNWREVEITFMKRADGRGSSSKDDHKYFDYRARRIRILWRRFLRKMRNAEDKLLEYSNVVKNSKRLDRMRVLLGEISFLKSCQEKANKPIKYLAKSVPLKDLSQKFNYEVIFVSNSLEQIREMYFVDKMLLLFDVCYPEKVVCLAKTYLLPKVRIWEDVVPIVKIFLYELLPLSISIILFWNFSILVLYCFNEDIIDVMQPFPDWKIIMILLLIPVVLSTLLHRYWTKDQLYELRCYSRYGLLDCLIVYYMPLDEIVYGIFIAVNGILFPSDWFKID